MLNSMGDNIESWGTPWHKRHGVEPLTPSSTFWICSTRKEQNHCKTEPQLPTQLIYPEGHHGRWCWTPLRGPGVSIGSHSPCLSTSKGHHTGRLRQSPCQNPAWNPIEMDLENVLFFLTFLSRSYAWTSLIYCWLGFKTGLPRVLIKAKSCTTGNHNVLYTLTKIWNCDWEIDRCICESYSLSLTNKS